jgi:mandelate racemase
VALASLTFKEIKARPVICKLTRPAVARIGAMTHLPLILIDLFTEEGVVGRSYLKPYLPKTMKYLIPALLDFGEMLKGRRVSPVDLYETARKSLHFVGYQGLSMIAVAGLDMAAWDALAKAADVPLCVLLGGSVGPVNAYNSNGLWLQSPESAAAEAVELLDERGGGFRALKLRLGRADAREDLATIKAVRDAIGEDIDLMVDFNQALNLADALRRCHMIDDHGLVWIEEPVLRGERAVFRRLRAATRSLIRASRAPRSSLSSSVVWLMTGRGSNSSAEPMRASMAASHRSVLASWPEASAKRRAWRGLTLTMGNPASARVRSNRR